MLGPDINLIPDARLRLSKSLGDSPTRFLSTSMSTHSLTILVRDEICDEGNPSLLEHFPWFLLDMM